MPPGILPGGLEENVLNMAAIPGGNPGILPPLTPARPANGFSGGGGGRFELEFELEVDVGVVVDCLGVDVLLLAEDDCVVCDGGVVCDCVRA